MRAGDMPPCGAHGLRVTIRSSCALAGVRLPGDAVRILLVEDDVMLAETVSRALTQSAHAVDCARTGDEADRALATESYDLVLLDVGLPQIDGFEVLRRLRARRISARTRASSSDRRNGLVR